MNAKKCKQLRRVAQAVTRGKPERVYVRAKTHRGMSLDPKCTRGMYRFLKKTYGTHHPQRENKT